MEAKVVNRHFEDYDIYIGRGTKWGNPFIVGKDGTREEVIELYRQYARNNPVIMESLHELRGKRLGCSCKPAACHGDILLELMEVKYNHVVIGIDESYTRTGISIAADGKLLKAGSIDFKGCKNKAEKRKELRRILIHILESVQPKATLATVICERIRLKSQKFISIDYIKSTGALVGTMVDIAAEYGVKVFSVDTRSWKAQVVGTCKGEGTSAIANKIPTLKYVIKLGFRDDIVSLNKNGEKVYNDDAADSACIALYGFVPKNKRNLKLEE
jgi:Holliday junction resolvasome RuvABC endonuclease subunit